MVLSSHLRQVPHMVSSFQIFRLAFSASQLSYPYYTSHPSHTRSRENPSGICCR